LLKKSEDLKYEIVWIQKSLTASQKHFNALKEAGSTNPVTLEEIKRNIENNIKDLESLRGSWRSNKRKRKILFLQ